MKLIPQPNNDDDLLIILAPDDLLIILDALDTALDTDCAKDLFIRLKQYAPSLQTSSHRSWAR
jgi:hypothetical protein